MNCTDFVSGFTDYIDGDAPRDAVRDIEAHLAECASCRRYKDVLESGASLLRALPTPELREDFAPRLQHRLYNLEEERVLAEQATSGAPALTVLGIAMVLTAAAWLPVLRGGAPVVELAPIVVDRAPSSVVRPIASSLGRPSSSRPRDLDDGLWEDARLYEYSPLSQRYGSSIRTSPVGFVQDR